VLTLLGLLEKVSINETQVAVLTNLDRPYASGKVACKNPNFVHVPGIFSYFLKIEYDISFREWLSLRTSCEGFHSFTVVVSRELCIKPLLVSLSLELNFFKSYHTLFLTVLKSIGGSINSSCIEDWLVES
jgi:hypothetical protein